MATNGQLIQEGMSRRFGEVVTNSRAVRKGSVFVALRGEKFDGHDFLPQALRRGARCVIIQRRPKKPLSPKVAVIRVPDTLRSLGDLAHFCRKRVDPKLLAITGSNGKTTTKEMVAAILERASIGGESLRGHVMKTEGNLNNLIGLPLTLLRLRGREKVAVVEMGTNMPGEIGRLSEIAAPDIGLITCIAPAHLAGLRNLSGIAREKGDLFRHLKPRGLAVVNLGDPWVRRLGREFSGSKVTYGKNGRVQGHRPKLLGSRGLGFTLQIGGTRREVRLRLTGMHNFTNALGAAAMAHALGVDVATIGKGLEAVRPFPLRMEIQCWKGKGIINDSYNANPASMEVALKTLIEVAGNGKKIAVLGDMLELGRKSSQLHEALGYRAARLGVDELFLLGKEAAVVRRGALRGGLAAERITVGKDHAELGRKLTRVASRGDWILFKGSRGMTMENVCAAWKAMDD